MVPVGPALPPARAGMPRALVLLALVATRGPSCHTSAQPVADAVDTNDPPADGSRASTLPSPTCTTAEHGFQTSASGLEDSRAAPTTAGPAGADTPRWVWTTPSIVELAPTTESATISTLMVITKGAGSNMTT